MSAAAERHARIRTLELLDGYTFRTASGLYGELLKIDGVGTTTMLHVLRSMEAAREIVVDRSDDGRRVLRYRLATPTAEELDGPADPERHARNEAALTKAFGEPGTVTKVELDPELEGELSIEVEGLTATKLGREIVSVGWDGHSQPMLRYRDELDRPDHLRSVVSVLDRDRIELARLQELVEANLDAHGSGWLQDDQADHNARELYRQACTIRKRLGADTIAPQELRIQALELVERLRPAGEDDPILVREEGLR